MSAWNFLRSLRPAFIVGAVVVWNALMLFAAYLNGGFDPVHKVSALLVIGVGMLSISIFSLGAIYKPSFRKLVLRPSAELAEAKPGLQFLGFLGTFLTLLTVFSIWTQSA